MNKSIMLVILVGFIALLIGCHAGGSAPFVNTPSESEIYSKEYDVLENGRFADIYLPSGAVIRCTADHTLKPGTKVTATEQKVANEANSDKGTHSYIYSITGKLYTGDALNTAVAVNSIEKPILVTIPNNSETGLCYLGTRTSESDPWRYTLAKDENQANTRFLRLSQTIQKNPTFNLYRLGIQFALFVFKNESKEEAQIDSVVVTPDKEVELKDGKYTGALTVKMNLEGENLNNIDPANLVARIIYRSENKDGANINFATNKTDSEDKAVSGTYEHTFEITKIDKTSIGNTAELTFVIELDGVSLEDFPKDFIVELYSRSDDEKTLPFSYTQEFGFETLEKQDEPLVTYSITYNLDNGQLTKDNPIEYTAETKTFILNEPTKTGYEFIGWTGSNGDVPQKPVSVVQGSMSDLNFTANWSIKSYNLTINKGTGINTVAGAGLYEYNSTVTASCTMLEGYVFDSWSGDFTEETFNMPANNVTLTANAKLINYNLTYTNVENCTFAKANPTTYTVETADFTLTNPTKDYYSFDGWVINGGEPVETVTISKGTHENRTYSAKFTPATYSITLDPNGGTVEYTTKEYNVETAEFSLPTPSRTNCEFLGWTLEGETTPVKTVKIAKGSNGNKTYTANWKFDLTLAINHDDDVVIDSVNNPPLYYSKATFTITATLADAVVMTDTEKTNVLAAICVKDSENNSFSDVSAEWKNDGSIALAFSEHLNASTTYTISFGDMKGINTIYTPFTFKTFYYKGKGVDGNPYLVENASQLDLVRNYMSNYFKQTEDISLESFENWVPIGDNSSKFKGSYDGGNKKITKLTINTNLQYAALFGSINSGSKIMNIAAEDFSITYSGNGLIVGGICGNNEGIISSCYIASSTISGFGGVGGICGVNLNSITSCYVASSTISGSNYIGGISGYLYLNSIISCYVASSTVSGSNYVGAICGGKDSGNISSCFTDNSAKPVGYTSNPIPFVEKNITSFETFSNINWPNDSWTDFIMSETIWPPKLNWEIQASQP